MSLRIGMMHREPRPLHHQNTSLPYKRLHHNKPSQWKSVLFLQTLLCLYLHLYMGVNVNDKIVAVHYNTGKPMWEPALWYPGGVRRAMLVGDGQLNRLATK